MAEKQRRDASTKAQPDKRGKRADRYTLADRKANWKEVWNAAGKNTEDTLVEKAKAATVFEMPAPVIAALDHARHGEAREARRTAGEQVRQTPFGSKRECTVTGKHF